MARCDKSPRALAPRFILSFIALLLVPAPLFAQTTATVSVRGTISARSGGGRIAGARVVVRNPALDIERTTVADGEGNFSIKDLTPGEGYAIEASAEGFAPVKRKELRLAAGEPLVLGFELEVAGVEATADVVGAPEAFATGAPEVSQLVGARQLTELPSNGRALNRFALLDPHVRNTGGLGSDGSTSQRLSINSGSYRQTYFKLDGSSNYDFVFANAPQQQVSPATVREFKVLTNQYSAEHGGSSTGLVSAVTRAGTQQFHGEGFFFARPSGPQAAPPVSDRHVPNELEQFGGSLGGPLFSSRATFFVNYERSRQNRGSFVQSPSPLAFTGHGRDQLGLARFDYQLGQKHSLALRANGNRSTNDNSNDRVSGFTQPSAATLSRTQSAGAQLTDQTVWGSRVNEFRLSYVNSIPSATSPLGGPRVSVVRPDYSTEGGSSYSWVRTQTWQAADQLTLQHGPHALKLGGDFTRQRADDFSFTPLGEYRFVPVPRAAGQPPAVPTVLSDYTQKFGTGFVRYGQTLASAFAQDDWRAAPRLTVNLGLRYDHQSVTDDRNNFAPRLGFAWDARGDGKTVIRGGAGVFYDQYYLYITRRFLLEGIDAPVRTYRFDYARRGGAAQTTPGAPAFPDALAALPAGAGEAVRDYVYLRPEKILNPYSAQFSLGVQRELFKDWTLTADVIHSRTLKQPRVNDINAPAPFARTAPGQTRPASAANQTRPFFDAALRASVYNGVRVNKVIFVENTASSTYDALDLGLVRRMTRRFQFESHYVYSSALTTSMFFGEPDTGVPNLFRVAERLERAPSDFHQRHRFVSHALVETPLGTQVSFVATLASGLPVNPLTGLDDDGDGFRADRPAGFARNSFRAPAQASFDASAAKRFRLKEGARLEMRAEVFNLFNRSNFVRLNGTYGNGAAADARFLTPLAGVQNVDPGRQFQLGARLVF
ncbi:MAG TPA: TonB-dependent receptor [Pyrinomonadaceae bacterium]|jgi:outer membrane receptor protein involved in Fe transport